MKPTYTLFTALLLAPLAALCAGRTLPEVPIFGKLRSVLLLEDYGVTANAWN